MATSSQTWHRLHNQWIGQRFERGDIFFIPKIEALASIHQRNTWLQALLNPKTCIDPSTKHGFNIIRPTDANWAGCPGTRKSSSGVLIGFLGSPVVFIAKTQAVIAQSSAASELYAIGSSFRRTSCTIILNRSKTWKERGIRDLNIFLNHKEHRKKAIWHLTTDKTHSADIYIYTCKYMSEKKRNPEDHDDFGRNTSIWYIHQVCKARHVEDTSSTHRNVQFESSLRHWLTARCKSYSFERSQPELRLHARGEKGVHQTASFLQ